MIRTAIRTVKRYVLQYVSSVELLFHAPRFLVPAASGGDGSRHPLQRRPVAVQAEEPHEGQHLLDLGLPEAVDVYGAPRQHAQDLQPAER